MAVSFRRADVGDPSTARGVVVFTELGLAQHRQPDRSNDWCCGGAIVGAP